jgi:hypothetical protein
VLEFGPPAKLAVLTAGTKVAEWQTQRGYATADYVPYCVQNHRHWSGYYSTPNARRGSAESRRRFTYSKGKAYSFMGGSPIVPPKRSG